MVILAIKKERRVIHVLKMKSQGKQLLEIVLAIKGGRDLYARLSVQNGQREQKGINLRITTGETQSYISCCQRRVLNNCINGQYIRSNRGIKVSLIIIMHLRAQMVNVFHSKE